MSGTWVLVPVKRLAHGKSRLSSRLSPSEREKLSLAMLRDVLTAVGQAHRIAGCLVIHSDSLVEQVVAEMCMQAIIESPETTDLNAALLQGLEKLAECAADGVLILPADVPLVDAESIDEIVVGASDDSGIAICPALDDDGTNALFVRPVAECQPSFGPGSFQRHIAEARSRGQSVTVLRLASVALDIDEPHDLDRFLQSQSQTHALSVLCNSVPR